MNEYDSTGRFWTAARNLLGWGAAACLALALISSGMLGPADAPANQVPSTDGHVPELATYLRHVQSAEPVVYRQLSVYPVLLRAGVELGGRWLSLDTAVSRGVLVVTEKGAGGSVPVVMVENRSRDQHVFIMTGEVISGGKQTRTVRNDIVLAPGQRIPLDVYCVEAHRWQGGKQFSAGKTLLPQSIQRELRGGADQSRIWSEVARNNAGLGAENATGSLELALNAKPVREKLAEVQRTIVPRVPQGTAGFVFVDHGRALGAEFFGREGLARAILPKLLDSYAVDCVLLRKAVPHAGAQADHRVAIDFFERVCRTGSRRASTPGSGAGIRTRSGGLLGDGVSLGGTVVHYGVQVQDRIVPYRRPHPPIPRRQFDELP
jgi:hypothetical protein